MIFPHLIHVRLNGSTFSKNIWATVAEQATAGEVEQRWHYTGDGVEFLVPLPSAENGDGLQQSYGVRMLGLFRAHKT